MLSGSSAVSNGNWILTLPRAASLILPTCSSCSKASHPSQVLCPHQDPAYPQQLTWIALRERARSPGPVSISSPCHLSPPYTYAWIHTTVEAAVPRSAYWQVLLSLSCSESWLFKIHSYCLPWRTALGPPTRHT